MINTSLSGMPLPGTASIQSPIQKALPTITKTPTNPYGGPDISFIEKLMESMGMGQDNQGFSESPNIRPPMMAGTTTEPQKKEGPDDLPAFLNSLKAMLQGNTSQPQDSVAGAAYGGTLKGTSNQRISDMLGYGALSGDNTQGWGRK